MSLMQLFGKKEPRLVAVEPAVIETNLNEKEFAEQYNSLVKKLGIEVTYTEVSKSTELRKFLIAEGIQMYARASVEKYMDKQGYWKWFPLHNKNRFDGAIPRATPHKYGSIYGGTDGSTYHSEHPHAPIPLPVLLTMDRIVERFGNEAVFMIAALKKNPDPFLGVYLKGHINEFFIVERWDEPGYRDK